MVVVAAKGRKGQASAKGSARRGHAQAAAAAGGSRSKGVNAVTATDGASFVRPHLRDLAAYTPIEPFEVWGEASVHKLDPGLNASRFQSLIHKRT